MRHPRVTFAAAALAAVIAGAAGSGVAHAEAYVSGSVGLLSPNDTGFNGFGLSGKSAYDNGIAINGAIGLKLPMNFRLEAEIGYGHTGFDKLTVGGVNFPITGNDVDLFTGTANLFYDIQTGTSFTPYLGGGIGFAYQDRDSGTVAGVPVGSGSETDFMWLLEAGVSYALNPKLAIVPSYRYEHINNGGFQSGMNVDDLDAHVFKIGLRYTF